MFNVYLALVVAILTGLTLGLTTGISQVNSRSLGKKGRCIYYNSLKAYDCAELDLSTIPNELSTAIEVLDVSTNRIRELTSTSFINYAYLKKLYLNDNMILTIEEGTFDGLTSLDTLDLSTNALVEVPVSLLHLPSLKRLMLSNNKRLDIINLFNKAAPVTAPIQYLDISHNSLMNQLPHFGVMMDLTHLNITGNHVTNVSKSNFVGLCNFRYFSNENLSMEFSTACDCAKTDRWFQVKKVISIPDFVSRCEFAYNKCNEDVEPTASELAADEKCVADFEARETMKNVSQICIIVFGVIGGVILVVGFCYVYYRLQRFSDDEKDMKKDTQNNNASVNLLKRPYEES